MKRAGPAATVLTVLRDAAHDRALARYLRYHVRPYSGRYRHVLTSSRDGSGSGLAGLPLTSLDDAGDPGQLVLRPTKATIRAGGDLTMRAQLLWATLWRREPALARRVIDPIYKPVHWLWVDGTAVGYSAEDLERLGEVGRLRLQSAGVTTDDVVVDLTTTTASLGFWQLALGARRGGVPTLLGAVPAPSDLARLAPTVLTGPAGELQSVLDRCREAKVALPVLRTLIITGERPDPATRSTLESAAVPANVAVVAWWAPPGVRSLWGECRTGRTFHLVPAVDHVELVDPLRGTPVADGDEGEIVWTPIGWKGTVVLRLRTGVRARLAPGPCPSCGATVPRLDVVDPDPSTASSRSPRRRRRRRT